eukprot:12654143-Ditylum_brightwellii.AAC.1
MAEGVKTLQHHHQQFQLSSLQMGIYVNSEPQESNQNIYAHMAVVGTCMVQSVEFRSGKRTVLGKTEFVHKPPIDTDEEDSESSNDNEQNKTNLQKKRGRSRPSKNNDGRSKDTASSSSAAVPTVKSADRGNASDIGENYKKLSFTSDERKICLTGWVEISNLKNGELDSDQFAEPKFNSKRVQPGVMIIILISCWSDTLSQSWWLGENYHDNMGEITMDMTNTSVMIVGKVLGR